MARFWHDLRVLVVLGVTLLGSISISVLATGALDVALARLGLADGGVGALVPAAAAVLLGLGTGFLVFYWISPGSRARRSRAGVWSRRAGGGAWVSRCSSRRRR